MLCTPGIQKDFAMTAAGAEASAAASRNPETKATFLRLANAYRELARQMEEGFQRFPSIEDASHQLGLAKIWIGASFWGVPSNDTHFERFATSGFPRAVDT